MTVTLPKTTKGELLELETRCRAKAEAAHCAAERLQRIREGNDIPNEHSAIDPETVAWAERLTDTFYWLKSSESAERADLSLLNNVGGCFESIAEALALVGQQLDQKSGKPRGLERLLPLVCEAQSALRSAFQRLGDNADPDQMEVFEWVKTTAARHHIYIKRFMRADDLADPTHWPELIARIESTAESGRPSPQLRSQIERLREQVDHIQAREDDAGQDWRAVVKTVDEIIAEGVPASNREIRALLLPVIDDLPESDNWPDGFRRVLKEIDRFLGTRPPPKAPLVSDQTSAEVKEAARLLNGRSVLLIGGKRRREAQHSLKNSLGLADLVWLETKEHQAIGAFEPLIARPNIAIVLLAIRWSSHAFGDVMHLCDRHKKPLVRLPGGYNPNQVAAQILAQCSGQLENR
jgi:hypothetical protein